MKFQYKLGIQSHVPELQIYAKCKPCLTKLFEVDVEYHEKVFIGLINGYGLNKSIIVIVVV